MASKADVARGMTKLVAVYIDLFAATVDELVEEYEQTQLGYAPGISNPTLRNFAVWVKEREASDG